MNIFILDRDPVLAARYLADRHVVKMTLESFQMLSTVHRVWGSTEGLYKITHLHHPCTVWLLTSASNYRWLVSHVESMHEEYTLRYQKTHKSFRTLYHLVKDPPPQLEDKGLTPFALAMSEVYKREDPVLSYRLYYITDKIRLCHWKSPSQEPPWFRLMLANIDKLLRKET